MNQGFWGDLKKPIIIQAPMANVTDAAFRQIIAKYSRPAGPAVFYTEFVSADGLGHPLARQKLKRELYFTDNQRPIVAQIFSGRPEKIKAAAKLIGELGFDGLDINIGCPDRKVESQGAGAALIKDHNRAQAVIEAAKEGVTATGRPIPVSVKTRIGYHRLDEWPNWSEALIQTRPAAITFHLRTRKEMSKVPAHWDVLPKIVRQVAGSGVLIFGNGDVTSLAEAKRIANDSGADGIMIGRAIFGNPWLYSGRGNVSVKERLEALVEHTKLFEKLFGRTKTNRHLFDGRVKNFAIMKKHFKAYVSGVAGGAKLRAKLMATNHSAEVKKIVSDFLADKDLLKSII